MPTRPAHRTKPTHGPFYGRESKGCKNLGRELKAQLTVTIQNKECVCELCQKHGPRGFPPAYFWAAMPDPRKNGCGPNSWPRWVFPKPVDSGVERREYRVVVEEMP
jgi:hypothetical protein